MYWYFHFPKAFTPQECASIKAHAMTIPAQPATTGHGGKVGLARPEIRRSSVRWLNRWNPDLRWLFERIEVMGLHANAEGFGLDISGQAGGFKDVQFTEYSGTNEGHYDWHVDNTWRPDGRATPFDRKMSMVVQLTDPKEYQGGKLELSNDPLPANLFVNQGDTVFFPSFNSHRVLPVTAGVRHSLVTWFLGPRAR